MFSSPVAGGRLGFLLVLVVSFFAPFPSSAQTTDIQLQIELRLLEKAISAVRGLPFKTPVQSKVIKRPADVAKSLQGYYVPREKALYVFDDVAGNYQKGVLIHELVHALQDQHFDLEKMHVSLHQPDPDSDRALAVAALVEGDATFTMIEVLKKDQPKVAGMLDVPIEKAKNVRNAFLYAQGARYVKALKDKGGWARVNSSYLFPPRSTAAILNLGGVATVDLGPGKVMGALALFEKLVAHTATPTEAMKLALGWRGGQVTDSAAGKATVFACKDKEHAALLGKALQNILPSPESSEPSPRVIIRDTRIFWYQAPRARLKDLRDRMESTPKVAVFSKKAGRLIPFGDMIEELLGADVVCIGEDHDSDPQHRVQLRIIETLHAEDARLGVGLEMFQKPFQKSIDRYFEGTLSEEAFLKESEYEQRWGYDWSLVRPVVEFCRRNQLPLTALNAPRELTKRISQLGIAALLEDERRELGPIDLDVKDHRDHWYELLARMHGNDKATPEQKERSYQVMATWDDFMARTAVDFQRQRELRRLVVIAGSGHVNRGFGIPQRAARYSGGKVLTIGMAAGDTAQTGDESLTDYQIRFGR